jgi:hypothetical protein
MIDEQLYDYGWKHYADYNFGPKRFRTDSALRIFWEEMTKEAGFRLLKDVRDSLLEFPRPSYEWTSGPTALHPWVKHTASVPPLTKEALERYLRNQIKKPSPEEIMSRIEWYWTARQEKLDHGQDG